jgi:nitrite reductase/ring-hydroxylating ferredoxin subunit
MTEGRVTLGHLDGFPDGCATPATYRHDGKETALLVVRQGPALVAYADLCPHLYLPLTWRGRRVLSEDGTRLRCTNHAAEFAVSDGRALSGPTKGCGLNSVPLAVSADGVVSLADAQ